MPTYVQGNTSTADMLSNRIPIDMSEDISRKIASNAPFTVLLNMMASQDCDNRKFEWMERDDWDNTVTCSAAQAADQSTITFGNDEYKKLRISDMVYNPTTGEVFRVTATPTTSSVAVTPNFPDGSGGSAVANGEVFYIVGSAQDEWSDVRDLISTKPVAKYNYIQHFRDPFGVSGRLNATKLIGPGEMQYLDEDVFRNHMRQQELAYLFGGRGISGDITSTGGIKYFMDQSGSGSYQRDLSGTPLTQAELLDWLSDGFLYGSPDKLLITGRNVQAIINGFAYEKLRVDNEVSKWGLNVSIFEAPDGIVRIMRHRMFTELGLDDEAWLIDMGALRKRGLAGRMATSLNTGPTGNGIQGNGVDGMIYEYTTEAGLEMRHPERFGRLYNVPQV